MVLLGASEGRQRWPSHRPRRRTHLLPDKALVEEPVCPDPQMCLAGAAWHLEYEGETDFSSRLGKQTSVTRSNMGWFVISMEWSSSPQTWKQTTKSTVTPILPDFPMLDFPMFDFSQLFFAFSCFSKVGGGGLVGAQERGRTAHKAPRFCFTLNLLKMCPEEVEACVFLLLASMTLKLFRK